MLAVIDRNGRTQVAELLRHFMAGQITNDEFEDRLPVASRDAAVSEVKHASWYLYDDLREYRLTGADRASADARAAVARWVVFLGSNLEYEYPVYSPAVSLAFDVASLCTLGLLGWAWRRRHRDARMIWPFFRMSDYEAALRRPVLLAGQG